MTQARAPVTSPRLVRNAFPAVTSFYASTLTTTLPPPSQVVGPRMPLYAPRLVPLRSNALLSWVNQPMMPDGQQPPQYMDVQVRLPNPFPAVLATAQSTAGTAILAPVVVIPPPPVGLAYDLPRAPRRLFPNDTTLNLLASTLFSPTLGQAFTDLPPRQLRTPIAWLTATDPNQTGPLRFSPTPLPPGGFVYDLANPRRYGRDITVPVFTNDGLARYGAIPPQPAFFDTPPPRARRVVQDWVNQSAVTIVQYPPPGAIVFDLPLRPRDSRPLGMATALNQQFQPVAIIGPFGGQQLDNLPPRGKPFPAHLLTFICVQQDPNFLVSNLVWHEVRTRVWHSYRK